jgi:putative transposase
MSVDEKRAMVNPSSKKLSILRQCELIELPRSSFYRTPQKGESEKNIKLMRLIDEEYTRHPFLGSRQMRNYLRRHGHKINRKRVERLMKLMGIQSVAPKPNTSKPSKEHKIYPYLLGGLDINRSNQVWCSDITYVRMPGGFVYLTAVMDWYSRKVLSWEVSVTMDDAFCVDALERAIRLYGRPAIFNTDQGSQFTGKAFTDVLKANGITISMDGKGRAVDNIMVERLWRSVKYEEIYLKEYASVLELIKSLRVYFDYYNNERTHSTFGGRTPAEVYDSGVAVVEVA